MAGFKNAITAAKYNYDSLPMLTSEQFKKVEQVFYDAGCNGLQFAYEDGQYQLTGYCDEPTIPAAAVQSIYELDMFDNITYPGYEYNLSEGGLDVEAKSVFDTSIYKFEVTANIKSSSVEAYYSADHSAAADAEATEETTEEGAE